jgi:hypothetical protein
MRPPALPLLLLAALALLAAPAAAEDALGNPSVVPLPDSIETAYNDYTRGPIDIDAYNPGRQAIAQIDISAPPGSVTRLNLYDQGRIIPAVINRTTTGDRDEIITYSLGDQTAGPYARNLLWPLSLPDKEQFTIQYAVHNDYTRVIWMHPWQRAGWSPLQTQLENVIYRATFEADEPTRLIVQTAPYDDATAAIDARADADAGNAAGGIVSLLLGLFDGIVLVVSLGWYLFATLFIDNFLLFLGLFEAVGLAYAANKSRDIFQFARKFTEYNAKAINAMFWLIEKMITILTRVINALKPI